MLPLWKPPFLKKYRELTEQTVIKATVTSVIKLSQKTRICLKVRQPEKIQNGGNMDLEII